MKKILIIISVLAAFVLVSCNQAAKTNSQEEAEKEVPQATEATEAEIELVAEFEILVDKSMELESRLASSEEVEVATAAYEDAKKEITKFLVDRKGAIDSLSQKPKIEFQTLLDKTTLGGSK